MKKFLLALVLLSMASMLLSGCVLKTGTDEATPAEEVVTEEVVQPATETPAAETPAVETPAAEEAPAA